MLALRGGAGSTSRARRSSASNGVRGWPESGGTRSDHMALMMASMLWGVLQAVADILPLPSPPPRQRDAVDPSARNSAASRRESDRAVARQCRVATRRRAGSREYRASLPGGAHADLAERATARQARPRAGMTRRFGSVRCGFGRDEGRVRTACPASARGRRESTAAIPGRYAYGSAAISRRARQCKRRDHPRSTAGSADRLLCAPKARVERSSVRLRQAMAARRPAARQSPACRDRARKVRPQWDHLRARGCCGRLIVRRAERRMAAKASAEVRCAAAPADAQIARKSGLRRTHSHANPRAFRFSSAR